MKRCAFAVLIIMATSMHAYIYQAVVMKKWHHDLQRYHYFIGLGDFHNKKSPINASHRKQLHTLFANVDTADFKIFTEDLSVANMDGNFSSNGFFINSRGGVLGGLTQTSRLFGIETDNLEYRYARVCALGPVLNNLKKSPFAFASTRKIRIRDLTIEIHDAIDQIASFRDGSILNNWYQEQSAQITQKLRDFYWPSCQDATVAEYLTCMNKPMLPLLNKLLTFDASVLDMKMVHEIVQNDRVERICAIAGGSHIDRASKALKKIGYTSVFETKPVFQRETSIDVGSVIRSRKKPQPIALDTLQKFF